MSKSALPAMSFAPSVAASDKLRSMAICSECDTAIELAAPCIEKPANPWICLGCGSVYFGRPKEFIGRQHGGGCRRTPYEQVLQELNVHISTQACLVGADALRQLVKLLAVGETPSGAERRNNKRFNVAASVVTVPLASNFRIAGTPAMMVTTNVSRCGAALVHTAQPTQPYLAMDFSPTAGMEELHVILEVKRVRSLGLAFDVGGSFVAKIEDFRLAV
jgi:hypothetical protein